MANWLEDEERNQAIQRRSDLLESQLRQQREEEVLKRLSKFHALCKRVNGVKPGSLSIDRFKVEGQIGHISAFVAYGEKLTGKRRGIQISCPSQDITFIDVVITELFDTRDIDGPSTGQRDIVVVRKTCCLQDLSDWKEDEILHAIKWMMNEAEAVKGSLPGREIMNAEGRLVIRFPFQDRKYPDHVQVVVDGDVLGSVDHYDQTNFGPEGCAFDLGIGEHQLTVSVRGSSRSVTVTIHLVAEHVTEYEVYFGFLGRINLKPV